MADNVKNVLFRLQADTGQLRRELDAIKSGLGNIGAATKGAENQISGLRKSLTGAAAAFGGISIAASAIDFGKGALEAVKQFENVNISLETFLGSSEKAKEVFGELEQFAIKTPFTPDEVNNAAKALLAFGEPVEGLTDTLSRIGDVSAATGKNFNELAVIYGKARTQGTLFAEDINQLTEAGIPIIGLFADQFKTTEENVKKLGSEGQIKFKNLEDAFKTLTEEGGRFFGLTERLSLSTAGRISNVEGGFVALQRSIGQGLLPVFERTLDAAFAFLEGIKAVPQLVQDYGRALTLLGGAVAFYVGQKNIANQAELIYQVRIRALIIQEQLQIAVQRLRAFWTRATALSTNALTSSTALYTAATRVATAATTTFSNILKTNPLGLIATAAATAAAFLIDFGDAQEEAVVETEKLIDSQTALKDSQEAANQESAKQVAELDKLVKQIKNTNTGSSERKKLVDQLNNQYGTTLKNISDEKKFIKQLDEQYQELVLSIKSVAFAKAAEGKIIELTKQQLDLEDKLKVAQEAKAFALKKSSEINNKEQDKTLQLQRIEEENLLNIAESTSGNADLIQSQLDLTTKAIDDLSKKIADSGQTIQNTDKTSAKSAEDLAKKRRELLQDLTREIEVLNRDISTQKIELVDAKTFDDQKKRLELLSIERKKAIDEELNEKVIKAQSEGVLTETIAAQFAEVRRLKKLKVTNETEKQISDLIKQEEERRSGASAELEQVSLDTKLQLNQEFLTEATRQRQFLEDQLQKATSNAERQAIQEQIQSRIEEIKDGIKEEEDLQIQKIIKARDRELAEIGLIPEERALITAQADLDILKIRQNTADQLQDIDDETLQNQIDNEEKRKEEIKKGIDQVIESTKALTNAILEAAIAQTDIQINAQQKRIEKARELAEKGNAELLQAEEDRLTKLNEKRARFVRTQQALAAIELVANSAVAISKAAAEGGAAAPFTIAATLIALAAGLVAARAQAQSAAGSFAEGGFTGEGSKYEPAGVVHKGEFVFTKEKTKRFRPLFESIHKGRDPFLNMNIERNQTFQTKTMENRLERIEVAIKQQKGLNLSIDENGINGIVTSVQYKQNRIRNKAR